MSVPVQYRRNHRRPSYTSATTEHFPPEIFSGQVKGEVTPNGAWTLGLTQAGRGAPRGVTRAAGPAALPRPRRPATAGDAFNSETQGPLLVSRKQLSDISREMQPF